MSTSPTLSAGSHPLPTLFLVVAARALLWFAWFVGLVLWAPRIESVFRGYNCRLPSSAELLVAATHGEVPIALLLSVTFIILDWSVSSRLRRAGTMAIWPSLMTLAPLALITLSVLAFTRPMLRLLEIIASTRQ
jgi:hypothetical protein